MHRAVFFFTLLAMPALAQAAWFSGSDALTSAHQKLLEGNTAASFDAMVEAWQQDKTDTEERHLTELLSLAITEDCGRSLSTLSLPSWLQSVVIRRETVQTPNRVYYQFSIYGHSKQGVSNVSFSEWPEKALIDQKLVNKTPTILSWTSWVCPAPCLQVSTSWKSPRKRAKCGLPGCWFRSLIQSRKSVGKTAVAGALRRLPI